jgi:hypothetical protein
MLKVFKNKQKNKQKELDLIHMNICGLLLVPSLCNSKYFMTLRNDYSHFTWVYFLKRKDEALLTFKVFKQMIENLSALGLIMGGSLCHILLSPTFMIGHLKAVDSAIDSTK